MSWLTSVVLLQTVRSSWRFCSLSAATTTIPTITTTGRFGKVSDSVLCAYFFKVCFYTQGGLALCMFYIGCLYTGLENQHSYSMLIYVFSIQLCSCRYYWFDENGERTWYHLHCTSLVVPPADGMPYVCIRYSWANGFLFCMFVVLFYQWCLVVLHFS